MTFLESFSYRLGFTFEITVWTYLGQQFWNVVFSTYQFKIVLRPCHYIIRTVRCYLCMTWFFISGFAFLCLTFWSVRVSLSLTLVFFLSIVQRWNAVSRFHSHVSNGYVEGRYYVSQRFKYLLFVSTVWVFCYTIPCFLL